MEIQSQKSVVNASKEEVYNFLSNAANIEALLPSKNIEDFQATETACSFKVQGGFTISLEQSNLVPNEQIGMKSGEKSPFPFELTVHIEEENGETVGYLLFNGKVNKMMQMMVKKPLTNLFDYMSHKLKEKYLVV
jgi:carbon monoxide dehydrogenase subunit G